MKEIGNGQSYHGILQNKVPLKLIRKESIRKETKKKASRVITIVMWLSFVLLVIRYSYGSTDLVT